MKITELRLENFRGAHSLNLNFTGNLTVLFGVNGTGKTSILDASVFLLSWMVNRTRRSGVSGRHIPELDITNKKSFSKIQLIAEDGKERISWSLVKSREGHSGTESKTELDQLSKYTKQLREKITVYHEKINIPLFVYYPVNRAVLDIPLEIKKKHGFNLLTAYKGALESGASFNTFFEWFREREDLENESRRNLDNAGKTDGFQFPDRQLEAVRDALKALMPDFSDFTVWREPLRMEVLKNGKRLRVDQLSVGEKCLMAMVGDLARRMAIANPERTNPLDGEGVVLIDEIDLHLHPKWQRMIIPRLTKTFPNCQFLVSTHSPHVLTHVKPEQLYMLRESEQGVTAEHPSESYGKTVDRILEDLMGLETTRPEPVKEKLSLLYQKINQRKLAEARKIIKELKGEIGGDPELAKAEVLIRRTEIINK